MIFIKDKWCIVSERTKAIALNFLCMYLALNQESEIKDIKIISVTSFKQSYFKMQDK
jgi:hypothetical protein